jgi:serine/threonine protein phosphatase PrpC
MGNSFCVNSKLLERYGTKYVRMGVCGMQGYRQEMEDAHLIVPSLSSTHPDITLCGVFDGHSGSTASLYLKDKLVSTLGSLSDPLNPNQIRQCLFDLDESFHKDHPTNDSGSTIALTLIKPQANGQFTVVMATAGDSRTALIDTSTGAVVHMSKDHKPYDSREKNRILRAGGHIGYFGGARVDGLNMSRAFGDWPSKQNKSVTPMEQKITVYPTIVQIKNISSDHAVLLYCDGFTESGMPDETLAEKTVTLLKKSKHDPAIVAAQLCDEVESKDNMTMMITTFSPGVLYGSHPRRKEYLAGQLRDKKDSVVYEKEKKAFEDDAIKRGNIQNPTDLKEFLLECKANMKAGKNDLTPIPSIEVWERPYLSSMDQKQLTEGIFLDVHIEQCPLVKITDPLLGYGDGEMELAEIREEKERLAKEEKYRIESEEYERECAIYNAKRKRVVQREEALKRKQATEEMFASRYNLRRSRYNLRSTNNMTKKDKK